MPEFWAPCHRAVLELYRNQGTTEKQKQLCARNKVRVACAEAIVRTAEHEASAQVLSKPGSENALLSLYTLHSLSPVASMSLTSHPVYESNPL